MRSINSRMVKIHETSGGETLKCTEILKRHVRDILCNKDVNEVTYSTIKKGLVKYHPDKNPGSKQQKAEDNFKIINNVKDECFENKNDTNYKIQCKVQHGVPFQPRPYPPPPPPPPKPPSSSESDSTPVKPTKPKKTKTPSTINKNAECIRQVGTFANMKPDFKMDKKTFDPEKLKEVLPTVSPKLEAMLKKIDELDKADYEKDKTNYKHCIYIDFKGVYAKVVAAAMIAHDYNAIYDKSFKIDEKDLQKTPGKNFALLVSSTIYDKPLKVPLRKQIVEIFNRRPDNIHGELIRYIVLDSGFREGLDLFDTKYCHIIQDLSSPADERQAVGRNTRLCGQAGLKFHPTRGWPLHVYKYDVMLSSELQQRYDTDRMFNLFLKHNNIDIREFAFAKDLDEITRDVAVDYELTKNIHEFSIRKDKSSSQKESSTNGLNKVFRIEGGSKKRRGHSNHFRPKPPIVKKSYTAMRDYIKERFSQYKWPEAVLENQCKLEGGKPQIIKLNNTQNFLRLYYQPPSAYKGLLLVHSPGSGKTCSAIAIASSSWEDAGYTILYVTRHTLKSDVYKNMFQQVCSQTIKRKINKDEINIPDGKIKSPGRLLPKVWLEPVSFKQFSNACLKKNELYRTLKKLNGEEDPFHKTLIIIDEAHKMYANDVIGSERPNVDAITSSIQNSYNKSGKDSARLLLMTATPYTSKPMDMIKLVNLMRTKEEQLPTEFKEFYEEYLDDDGSFSTSGKKFFADGVAGYISYLNRANDARQFSYPIFHQELVEMSRSDAFEKKTNLINMKDTIIRLKNLISNSKILIQTTKRRFTDQINIAETKERKNELKEQMKNAIDQIKEDTETNKESLQKLKKDAVDLTKEVKDLHKTDMSQEFALLEKCKLPVTQ
jgi:superfamily II DNA or RNA helicase